MARSKLLFLIFWCTLLVSINVACAHHFSKFYKACIQHKISIITTIAIYSTYDLAASDPETYEVFLTIKKDYGIKEPIKLRTISPIAQHVLGFRAGYFDKLSPIIDPVIFLSPDYKCWSKSYLIHALAHELEHHRQSYKYSGSYHDNFINPSNGLKAECGADAASAGYLYCHNCLRTLKGATPHPVTTSKTAKYGFTTLKGYFCKDDFELYAKQAEEDNAQCLAHKTGTHTNSNTPLKDFLPPRIECLNNES